MGFWVVLDGSEGRKSHCEGDIREEEVYEEEVDEQEASESITKLLSEDFLIKQVRYEQRCVQ